MYISDAPPGMIYGYAGVSTPGLSNQPAQLNAAGYEKIYRDELQRRER
jgi:hypothetical protein